MKLSYFQLRLIGTFGKVGIMYEIKKIIQEKKMGVGVSFR